MTQVLLNEDDALTLQRAEDGARVVELVFDAPVERPYLRDNYAEYAETDELVLAWKSRNGLREAGPLYGPVKISERDGAPLLASLAPGVPERFVRVHPATGFTDQAYLYIDPWGDLAVGDVVKVPFGNGTQSGRVNAVDLAKPAFPCKTVFARATQWEEA